MATIIEKLQNDHSSLSQVQTVLREMISEINLNDASDEQKRSDMSSNDFAKHRPTLLVWSASMTTLIE